MDNFLYYKEEYTNTCNTSIYNKDSIMYVVWLLYISIYDICTYIGQIHRKPHTVYTNIHKHLQHMQVYTTIQCTRQTQCAHTQTQQTYRHISFLSFPHLFSVLFFFLLWELQPPPRSGIPVDSRIIYGHVRL